jgi:Tol biopolymer transport system component
VAYSWFRENRYELRLIDLVRGDGIPQSRLLLDNPDVEFAVPGDWSPDGKFISVAIGRNDKTSQIGLVSVADGALRVLKSVDWRGPTMLVFSPDGKYLAYDIPANDSSDQRDILVLAIDGSREIPVIVGPSQDTVVGWSNDGKRLLFASDRSGSEALWSVSFADGKVQGTPELLRRDIGQFSRLAFMDGKLYGIVDRPNAGGSKGGDIHTATVDFRSGKLESPPSLAVQTFVGNNTFPAWSPDGKYLAYVSRRGFVGLPHFVIAVRSLETGDVREISPSPGLNLLYSLAWTADGHSLYAVGGDTKGRYGIFRIDAQTGQTTILHTKEDRDAIPAAQGISADGKKLYFGKPYSVDGARTGGVGLIEKDLASGNEKELLKTPNRAAARLSPDGKYLAIRGLDPSKPRAMFILPVAGGQPRELASDAGGTPEWAADGSAVYTIKAPGELWRLPIDGAEPRKVDLEWAPGIVGFQVHPDGRRIAFQTRFVSGPAEIWVLENFLPARSAKNQ